MSKKALQPRARKRGSFTNRERMRYAAHRQRKELLSHAGLAACFADMGVVTNHILRVLRDNNINPVLKYEVTFKDES